MNQEGSIYKIENFSLHDGPGIRTLVVMKGCPLKCRWCSSPYTQRPDFELFYIKSRCTGCSHCITVCPECAITMETKQTSVKTNRSQCTGCGICVDACPNQARERVGREYTAEGLFHKIEKNAPFFRRSGGGITLGGGEPTLQAAFVEESLSLCRVSFFHTAMETCAFTSWEKLAPLLDQLDLVYIDLKHMDDKRHAQWTGVSNTPILENIQRTAETNQLILRIPVVPGFNDAVQNIKESAVFAKTLGSNLLRLELLPYHQFGLHKYEELERTCLVESIQPPSARHMETLRDIVRSFGLEARIGG